MDDDLPHAIATSAQRLTALAGGAMPEVAVLLGSGWGEALDGVWQPGDGLDYAELPGFPALQVRGHTGRVTIARVGERRVVVLEGRQHAYETGRCDGMKGAIRALAAAGVRALVQTQAVGSLDPALPQGALMLVTDHLNLPQRSPLEGEHGDARFVDMTNAYDPALREQAQACAARAGVTLHEGVYAWMLGPQFETPAEIRMLRLLGAHAVGMSLVPETLLARRAGLRVLAVAMVTNLAAGLPGAPALSHGTTLAGARAGAVHAARLMREWLSRPLPEAP